MKRWIKWKREGELFTRWVDAEGRLSRYEGKTCDPFVVEIFQIWRGYLLGWPVVKDVIVVGKVSVNRWIATAPFGDPLLTKEERDEFNKPARTQNNDK